LLNLANISVFLNQNKKQIFNWNDEMLLLRNIDCYDPNPCGKKDILIAGDKIEKILPTGSLSDYSLIDEQFDCSGLSAFPGIIDQHVHILGAGGEQGFESRTNELDVSDIRSAGVTTIVGLLGADGTTRTLENLYAKAKALKAQNVTSYLYSGSYAVPPVTFTGNITRDLVLIDMVIGAGEIAISDYRSSCPTLPELLRLASNTYLGGMLAKKAGVVHFHIGDGKDGLAPIKQILAQSDLPKEALIPTHTNRNPSLFQEAMSYCSSGGNIDLTAGETAGIAVPDAIHTLQNNAIELSRVTVSSDAGGSIPGGGVAKNQALFDDLIACIRSGITPTDAFRLATENVAKLLKLYPAKGTLQQGSDADVLIMDEKYQIRMLFSRGKLVLQSDMNQ
jgi:beta-aspartyl-dipeptidase (metallo-type)